MSHSRMGHQLCPWLIWPTCSVPRPGPGLGSSHGSTQASHTSEQAWALRLKHRRIT